MRIDEVRALSDAELLEQLEEQQRALMNLRFREATLQLRDTSEIRKTRRTVARVKTAIREREIVKELGES